MGKVEERRGEGKGKGGMAKGINYEQRGGGEGIWGRRKGEEGG